MGSTLEESAAWAGGHCWVERRLFEVLGGWVASTAAMGQVDAALMLDRHSRHCAWRAGQWWDRLPVLADVDRESLCVAPSPGWAAAIGALAGLGETAGGAVVGLGETAGGAPEEPGQPSASGLTGLRLSAAYRVVIPRLHTRYQSHRDAADPVADGSSRRTIGMAAADLAADWQEGERVLEAVLGPGAGEPVEVAAERIRVAASAAAQIEALIVGG